MDVYGGFKTAAQIGAAYPPTGLLYVASSAIKANHDVLLIDMDVERLGLDQVFHKIEEYRPDVIAVTATTPIYANAKKIIKEVKRRCSAITVLGGIHISILLEKVLQDLPELDFGVYGEGELTFVELLACIGNSAPFENVRSLIYRDRDGSIKKTPPRPMLDDLDSLPPPARQLTAKHRYLWSVTNQGVKEIAVVITKRGCPFNCRFCSAHSMFTHRVRYRSVTNVVDEIADIITRNGISHILILDDTLVIKRDWMVDFCDEIKKCGLHFTWEGMARANIIDLDILKLMSSIGLVRLSFGIESGDQDILNLENKGVTLEQLRQAYKWAKECGIETRGSAIIGHPGETRRSALKTIRFLRSIKHLDQAYINIMVPYPGTEVYEIAKKGEHGMRLLCENFEEYVRYDNSVIEVNDLDRKTLIRFQKYGLLYFYLTPRRILYNITRSGLRIGLSNASAFLKGILHHKS